MKPRIAVTLVYATLCLSGGASSVFGQGIRIRVVDSATTAPLSGALVALLAANNTVVTEGLTLESGVRNLAAPAGTYRVRVRRIGFQPYVSAPVTLPGAVEFIAAVPRRPVILATIVTSARSSCRRLSTDASDALGTVWGEAMKALQASRLTMDDLQGVGRAWTYRKTTRTGGVVEQSDTTYFTIRNRRPFGAENPARLANQGYVVGEPLGGWSYYGPDESVLLSSSFSSTHCFRIVREAGEPNLIGVAFQPVPRRQTSDIAGVVWLDQTTSELRRIVFRFVNAGLLSRFGGGGETHFRRLASGAWLVSSWHLRAPRLETVRNSVRAYGFIENGGGLLAPTAADSVTVIQVVGPPVTLAAVSTIPPRDTVVTPQPGRIVPEALPFGKPARYAGTDKYDGFYRRRAQGRGKFFTREDIERLGGANVLDMLTSVPGVAVVSPDGVPTIRVPRCETGRQSASADPSWLGVFLNGQRVSGGVQMLSTLDPSELEAMEVYRGASERPLEARGNVCAAIFLWSRYYGYNENGGGLLPLDAIGQRTQATAPGSSVATPSPARIDGRVLAADGGGMSGADVSLAGTEMSLQTDSAGRFRFASVPPGLVRVRARSVGFAIADTILTVASGSSYVVELRLVRITPQLDTVVTSAQLFGKPARYANTSKFDDFYKRRSRGVGNFFTLEDIQRLNRSKAIDLLTSVPGVTISSPGGVTTVRMARCGTGRRERDGEVKWLAVFLNGRRVGNGLQILSDLHPSEIETMEVYRGASQLPIEAMGDACAAIFVWTRFTPGELER